MKLGMEASFSKTVSEADIIAFAKVTGDKNAVHLESEYAAILTRWSQRQHDRSC